MQTEWDSPDRDDWVEKVEADTQAAGPADVVLVAHSLGCIAVSHWAGTFGTKIKGALLVAPSDCEAETYLVSFSSKGFSPIPLKRLPFPSIVVASTDDEWVAIERAKHFSDAWGSEFVNVGSKGHLNPRAGFGEWNEGLEILKRLD